MLQVSIPPYVTDLFFVSSSLSDVAGASSGVVKPYRFRMGEIEGFRYRVTVSVVPRTAGIILIVSNVCTNSVCVHAQKLSISLLMV